jgi:hypothetical protein
LQLPDRRYFLAVTGSQLLAFVYWGENAQQAVAIQTCDRMRLGVSNVSQSGIYFIGS